MSGRRKISQKRIGRREQRQVVGLLKSVKAFKIFANQKKLGETKLTEFLINHLRQNEFSIENRNIEVAKFVKETFRPECLLRGRGTYPLCAIECKKLSKRFAKSRWKEGLSQCLLYSHYYKTVIYLLFDYSVGAQYAEAFGRGNRVESRFAKELRDMTKVYIVALKPQFF